jgi:hypothetical protein
MKLNLPGEIEAGSVTLTLDDGRYVEVSGDGTVRVWGSAVTGGEYSLTLPSIAHVITECSNPHNAYANGHATITVDHRH